MSKKNETGCDCSCVHEDIISEVRQGIAAEDELDKVSDLYKAFGDRTRLNILAALSCHEMCVCDLAVLMDMTKSAVSHQLSTLRKHKLVTFRRSGKHAYYSLADDHVKDILCIALDHINEKGCEHHE